MKVTKIREEQGKRFISFFLWVISGLFLFGGVSIAAERFPYPNGYPDKNPGRAELILDFNGTEFKGTLKMSPTCESNIRLYGVDISFKGATTNPWETQGTTLNASFTGFATPCQGGGEPRTGNLSLSLAGNSVILNVTGGTLPYTKYFFTALGQVYNPTQQPTPPSPPSVPGTMSGVPPPGTKLLTNTFQSQSSLGPPAPGFQSGVPPHLEKSIVSVISMNVGEIRYFYQLNPTHTLSDGNLIPLKGRITNLKISVFFVDPSNVLSQNEGPGGTTVKAIGEGTGRVMGGREVEQTLPNGKKEEGLQSSIWVVLVGKEAIEKYTGKKSISKDPPKSYKEPPPEKQTMINIRGKAVMKGTRVPVGDATVSLARIRNGGYQKEEWRTKANGEFSIVAEGILSGEYDVLVQKLMLGDPQKTLGPDLDLWPIKQYIVEINPSPDRERTFDVGVIEMDTVDNIFDKGDLRSTSEKRGSGTSKKSVVEKSGGQIATPSLSPEGPTSSSSTSTKEPKSPKGEQKELIRTIKIEPDVLQIAPEGSEELEVYGLNARDQKFQLGSNEVTWSIRPTNTGVRISPQGKVTVSPKGKIGSKAIVTARYKGLTANATIEIRKIEEPIKGSKESSGTKGSDFIKTIMIEPGSLKLSPGESEIVRIFSVDTSGQKSFEISSNRVTWMVEPNKGVTISRDGRLSIANTARVGSTVKFTAQFEGMTAKGSASIAISVEAEKISVKEPSHDDTTKKAPSTKVGRSRIITLGSKPENASPKPILKIPQGEQSPTLLFTYEHKVIQTGEMQYMYPSPSATTFMIEPSNSGASVARISNPAKWGDQKFFAVSIDRNVKPGTKFTLTAYYSGIYLPPGATSKYIDTGEDAQEYLKRHVSSATAVIEVISGKLTSDKTDTGYDPTKDPSYNPDKTPIDIAKVGEISSTFQEQTKKPTKKPPPQVTEQSPTYTGSSKPPEEAEKPPIQQPPLSFPPPVSESGVDPGKGKKDWKSQGTSGPSEPPSNSGKTLLPPGKVPKKPPQDPPQPPPQDPPKPPGKTPPAPPAPPPPPQAITAVYINQTKENAHIFTDGETFGSNNRLAPGEKRSVQVKALPDGRIKFYAGRNGKVIDSKYWPGTGGDPSRYPMVRFVIGMGGKEELAITTNLK